MRTAGSRAINSALLTILLSGGLLLSGFAAWAAEPAPRPSIRTETAEQKAELFIKLLKRRAHQILEARRAPPPPLWSASFGISQGYESNVNLDGERRGDHFTQESLSLVFQPKINDWLRAKARYELFNSHYLELRDSNLWVNTLEGTLQLQPHRRLRLDLGIEYEVINFPFDADNSFFDQRFKTHLLFAQTPWLTHKLGWTYQQRNYDTRKALDGEGTVRVGANRQDHRHIASHELQFSFPKTFLRLTGEFYQNFSNELFQDFYDWENYTIRAAVSRELSPQWAVILAASYVRRNYESRSVPSINVAQRDDAVTLAGSLIYQISDNVELNYSLTYRHQDSNDPLLDFTDVINQIGVTLRF